MATHREVTADLPRKRDQRIYKATRAHELKIQPTFKPGNLKGKYLISCGTISSRWPDLTYKMQLRMHSSGRLAVFDFGIVYGMMILENASSCHEACPERKMEGWDLG